MSKPFLLNFCQEVQAVYLQNSPGLLRRTWVELDQDNHALTFRFGIAHPRGVDEMGIRFIGCDITVDFLPGAAITPLCILDKYGLRWIKLSYFSACQPLGEGEQQLVEDLSLEIYELCCHREEALRLVLGSRKLEVGSRN